MKRLAVSGCTLVCDNPTAQAVIVGTPSLKVKAGALGVYPDGTMITVTAASSGSYVQSAPASASLVSTCTKVKIDGGKAPLLELDKALAACPMVNPDGQTMVLGITVTIVNAGQIKVSGV